MPDLIMTLFDIIEPVGCAAPDRRALRLGEPTSAPVLSPVLTPVQTIQPNLRPAYRRLRVGAEDRTLLVMVV